MNAKTDGEKTRKRFRSVREAKEFLVGKIVGEAERDGVPLSEVERKMLYFTETGWTLPEMGEVNDRFDLEYAQDEYENKISGLVQSYLVNAGAENNGKLEDWWEAVGKLSEGDHYLSVMIPPACSQGSWLSEWLPDFTNSYSDRPLKRTPGDRLRLWIAAFALVFGGLALMLLLNRIFGSGWR